MDLNNKNNLLLSEYLPQSELLLEQHLIKKPLFPVIDESVPRQGSWKIHGLGLDNQVLEKIYSKNASNFIQQ